jgi:hypothetical protein
MVYYQLGKKPEMKMPGVYLMFANNSEADILLREVSFATRAPASCSLLEVFTTLRFIFVGNQSIMQRGADPAAIHVERSTGRMGPRGRPS